MPRPTLPEGYITATEAARRLNSTTASVIKYAREGNVLEGTPFSARWGIKTKSVERAEYIIRNHVTSVEAASRLGITLGAVITRIDKGIYPAVRLFDRYYIDPAFLKNVSSKNSRPDRIEIEKVAVREPMLLPGRSASLGILVISPGEGISLVESDRGIMRVESVGNQLYPWSAVLKVWYRPTTQDM